jgi:hypothetical protein
MNETHRKHISLSHEVNLFLENFQRDHQLPNFSATIEHAANALKREMLIAGYEQFASDYANSKEMQIEAQTWLEAPMLESKQ